MRHAESAIVHVASVEVAVPADYAFDRLSDAAFVGGWSLGSMGLAQHDGEVFVGTSLFDRSQAFVEIHPVRKLGLIDYSVGSASHREPRIISGSPMPECSDGRTASPSSPCMPFVAARRRPKDGLGPARRMRLKYC